MRYRIGIVLCTFLFLSAFTTEKDRIITIFMIGDSTMADRNTDNGNLERGWGQMLPRFLTEDIVLENHAACGRSTLSFINEGRWQTVIERLKKGDYVIIQFGHNDEKMDSTLHTEPGSTFDENLRTFVRETRKKGANPILMNSIVRRNYPPTPDTQHLYTYEKEGDILVDSHGKYADTPREVAAEMDVPFVDMNELTRELVSEMGTERSKELFMWIPAGKYTRYPEGKIDNTHLNIYGSKVVAGMAAEAMCEVVPELTGYVRRYDPEIYVADYRDNKKCAISYTFDDGLEEHYTLVYPELEKLDFKGTFWICGKIIEYEDAQLGKPRMTWLQLKEMSDKGHEISSHGWSHLNLKGKSCRQICPELEKNDSIILVHIGKQPVTFCYPGNSMDKKAVRLASKNRVATRVTQYAIGGEEAQSTPEKLDKWVNDLLVSGEWGVTMTHGITKGYDYFAAPTVFWNHLRNVKKREKDIWVDTFCNVGAYVKERNNVQLDVVKETLSYKVTPHLKLDNRLFTVPLTMVVEGRKKQMKVVQDEKALPIKNIGNKTLFDFNPYGGVVDISFE